MLDVAARIERGGGTDLHLGVHVMHLLAGAPSHTLGGPRAGKPVPQGRVARSGRRTAWSNAHLSVAFKQ
jgi:hypothetical protein